MNVLLINPPADVTGKKMVREGRCMQESGAWTSIWAPISLATTAAVLEELNFNVLLKDCVTEEITFEGLSIIASEFQPDLAIINTATPTIESDLSTSACIKEACPKALTAAFGIHVSALPEEVLKKEPSLDFAIVGECEYTICDLAKAIRDNTPIEKTAGLVFRKNGQINYTREREFIKDLDALPFPSWRHIDLKNYTLPFTNRPFLLVYISRGCPYNCTFCAAKPFYGACLRVRSAKNIVDELEWDKTRFGVSEFLFWTEQFTIVRQLVLQVCDEIKSRGLKISWVCNSRVDNVDFEMLSRMKEAGCWMIGYGIESGSQTVLDGVNKNITLEQSRNAVREARRAGLKVTGHFVVGLPGDTKETINETIEFSKTLDIDFAQFYCAVPFPGSELYQEALRKDWLATTDWRMFEQNYSVLNLPGITAKEIMALRHKAFVSFYLRPRYILKTLAHIRSLSEVKIFINMLRDFIRWI